MRILLLALVLLALVLLPLTACEQNATLSDDGFDAAPAAAGDVTITSRGGEVMMGLSDGEVYYRLSDSLLQEIDREMERERAGENGLGGAIADAVTGSVSDMLRHRVEYAIRDIRTIEYVDGTFRFVFEDGSTEGPTIKSESEDVVFAPSDAERFIDAFEARKRAAD